MKEEAPAEEAVAETEETPAAEAETEEAPEASADEATDSDEEKK